MSHENDRLIHARIRRVKTETKTYCTKKTKGVVDF